MSINWTIVQMLYKIIQYNNIIKSNLNHSQISNSFQEIHGVGVVGPGKGEVSRSSRSFVC